AASLDHKRLERGLCRECRVAVQRIVITGELRVGRDVLGRERQTAPRPLADRDCHRLGLGAPRDRSSAATNGAKYCFHAAATVWVPWPRVMSLVGIRTKRPCLTRGIRRSMIPSSGGLMRSSAELIASRGTVTRSRSGLGSWWGD